MSGYRGHLAFGFIVICILVAVFHFFEVPHFDFNIFRDLRVIPVILVLTGFFALVADWDIRTSKINVFISSVLLAVSLGFFAAYYFFSVDLLLVGGAFLVVVVLLSGFLKHRGFCHNPLFGLLLSIPLFFWEPVFFLVAFSAFLSHLFLDFAS